MIMTHTLILLRHAKSAWPQHTADADRPLAERGRRDAPAIGHWLRENITTIDLVVCSTAVRAVQTWGLAAAQLDATPRLRYEELLYGACAAELSSITEQFPSNASTVILVGHNPSLEDFLRLLTGATEPMKTSTMAVMSTRGRWEDNFPSSWTLEKLTTPRG